MSDAEDDGTVSREEHPNVAAAADDNVVLPNGEYAQRIIKS